MTPEHVHTIHPISQVPVRVLRAGKEGGHYSLEQWPNLIRLPGNESSGPGILRAASGSDIIIYNTSSSSRVGLFSLSLISFLSRSDYLVSCNKFPPTAKGWIDCGPVQFAWTNSTSTHQPSRLHPHGVKRHVCRFTRQSAPTRYAAPVSAE